MSQDDVTFQIATLISIIVLIVFTLSGPVFEKLHFHYMHESGVCMIIGVLVTLCATIINPEVRNKKTIIKG